MALLNILQYPDPRLHTVAKPVAQVDDRVRAIVADMFETMYAAKGVGLAATQVDIHERIIVVDTSEQRDQPMVLINPQIVERSADCKEWEEGCLSLPGIYDKVTRPDRIRVRALDARGEGFEIEADGLMAVCVQHEMDHLEGKVFVDYLSSLKRSRIKVRMRKRQRETEAA
ncbi:peptide deformylase [Thiomonas sp.]|jgi:peptide deformylase|uniref:peptide deformylase n=1 Tax=Thiomonas sp. TaxID=2047785 RepID=UPI0026304074|nr:peptide deformylase [Thiomonas sp.]